MGGIDLPMTLNFCSLIVASRLKKRLSMIFRLCFGGKKKKKKFNNQGLDIQI